MSLPGPIIDAHVHLWDPARLRYPWLASVPALAHRHTLDDFAAATAGLPITRRVFVQCDCDPVQARDEVTWVAAMAGIDAIVAYAPLELGERSESELQWLAGQPKVRGVRRILQGESAVDFCLQPSFVAGVRALARHGFTFDLCIRHDQLGAAAELVRRCPDVTFVLDHLGKPAIKDRMFDPWCVQLAQLAKLPNVVAKLSGLTTEADAAAWIPADLRPYVEHALACFGWERLLFGGDWPVVKLAGGYSRWVAALATLIVPATQVQHRALLHDNAARIYRLA
ncbi:MAG TPA: amidohydrolase family protein [Candidatus Binataceae bacterium]|jgi:L-fuconolactonase|nr:amidohydrolase family protein [Candidatus Binataceae bacterium]